MSTITTTAPSSFEAPRTSGRRILVAGAVVAGLVVAGAIAVPRLTSRTTTPTTYPVITPHDAVEHQLDTARAAALGGAGRHLSRGVERNVDLAGKRAAAATAGALSVPQEFQPALNGGETRMYVGGQLQTALVPQVVGSSVVAQQTGTIGHYAWTPDHATSVQKQQVGGEHSGYAYLPARSQHLAWSDPWVPPTDDPAWVPYITSHYFHPVSTSTTTTHEYR